MGLKTNRPDLLEALMHAKRLLFIGAHPDDIEFYCGGLVYLAREAGVAVGFLVATRGGRGRQGAEREKLEKLRSHHQEDAARILGGAEVRFLEYPDKYLAGCVDSFAADVQGHVAHLQPDYIFCWDPEFIYNPHPDHRAAAEACKTALEGSCAHVIYYGTTAPDLVVELDGDMYAAKMQSLRAHRTETPWYYWPIQRRSVRARLASAGEGIGCEYAEAFRVGKN